MSGKARAGQTFLLVAGFVCGALAGAWLGLVAAFVSSISPSGPARFSGEDFAAALVATFSLAAVYVLVRQTDRQGRAAALGLLFVASFAALCALYVLRPLEVLCVVPWPSVEASVGASVRHAVYQEATPGWQPSPACAPLSELLRRDGPGDAGDGPALLRRRPAQRRPAARRARRGRSLRPRRAPFVARPDAFMRRCDLP